MSAAFAFIDRPGERLSNSEAARYLGLKSSTLQKWRSTGVGPPFIKLGRLIQYRKADLDAFLMRGFTTPRRN